MPAVTCPFTQHREKMEVQRKCVLPLQFSHEDEKDSSSLVVERKDRFSLPTALLGLGVHNDISGRDPAALREKETLSAFQLTDAMELLAFWSTSSRRKETHVSGLQNLQRADSGPKLVLIPQNMKVFITATTRSQDLGTSMELGRT